MYIKSFLILHVNEPACRGRKLSNKKKKIVKLMYIIYLIYLPYHQLFFYYHQPKVFSFDNFKLPEKSNVLLCFKPGE